MKQLEQLEQWVAGNPLHNYEIGECCPDFSCCRGIHTMVDLPVRETFYAAYKTGNEKLTTRLLMEFLSRALSDEGLDKKVYIAGLEVSRQELD